MAVLMQGLQLTAGATVLDFGAAPVVRPVF
jgi:hypothetical protein